jgi:hypothetical protein
MQIKGKIAAVSLGAVALAGGIGVGVSYADDPSASRSPSATPSAQSSATPQPGTKKGGHAKKALLKRALHGEVTVGGKKQTRVLVFQRGTVDKVSGTSITVKSTDGFTATYVVNAETKVRKAGEAAKTSDIGSGDKVRVVARKDGQTSTARVIAEPK